MLANLRFEVKAILRLKTKTKTDILTLLENKRLFAIFIILQLYLST